MSLIGFAGAAQFAAVGYVAAGPAVAADRRPHVLPQRPPPAVQRVARAAAAPRAARSSARRWRTSSPTRRSRSPRPTSSGSGGSTSAGYWIGAVVGDVHPVERGDDRRRTCSAAAIPDPAVLGLDIVFPAAMAGLAVGLMTGRREVVAAGAGAAIGVGRRWSSGPSVGIVLGGLVGPLVGMAMPARRRPAEPVVAECRSAPAEPHGGRRGRGRRGCGLEPPDEPGPLREQRAGPARRAHGRRDVSLARAADARARHRAAARPGVALPAARRAGGARLDRGLADARQGTGETGTRS